VANILQKMIHSFEINSLKTYKGFTNSYTILTEKYYYSNIKTSVLVGHIVLVCFSFSNFYLEQVVQVVEISGCIFVGWKFVDVLKEKGCIFLLPVKNYVTCLLST
jgi:hypothetical protein